MEPDDLLCSRNARSEKTLVGRAQRKINQPPSLKARMSKLGRGEEGQPRWSCAPGTRAQGVIRLLQSPNGLSGGDGEMGSDTPFPCPPLRR